VCTALGQKLRLVPQTGHQLQVQRVSFSPDGKILASGSLDQTVKLWDVATGNLLRTLAGHTGEVLSVAFSPDGKSLASGGADKTIKFWDVATGREQKLLVGHRTRVTSLAFSSDGKLLASGGQDSTVKVWEVTSGRTLETLAGHLDKVTSLSFSPDNKTLASGSWDYTISLWHIGSGKKTRTLKGHSHEVLSVSFSPDGKWLVSGSQDNTLKLWDVASGKALKTLEAHSDAVFSVAFSPDGKTIASGSEDSTIKLWNAASGKALRTLKGHSRWVSSVTFSPNGRTLASGGADRIIRLWDVTKVSDPIQIIGSTCVDVSLSLSPDGKTIASGSNDSTIKLWNLASGKQLNPLTGHSDFVTSVAFSPDGQILASGSFDNTIKLWDVSSAKLLRSLKGHVGWVLSVSFSPDGKTLASASFDKSIKLWEVDTGRLTKTLSDHTSTINSVAFSPDGKTIASGSSDNTIKLWDAYNGRNLATFRDSSAVTSVSFSPDGITLASGSVDHTLKLWDVATGKLLRKLTGHTGIIRAVSFSPDGRTIASGSEDKSLKLWDRTKTKEIKSLVGQLATVDSISFAPDSQTVATASLYNPSQLWDVASGRELCALVTFEDGSWAVTDPQGRFDGSNNGQISSLHWVYDGKDGQMEPIGLEQFSNYYYTPGLLSKIYRRETLPAVPNLQQVALYPELKALKVDGSKVSANFVDRGGGFGDVHIIVNGIDVKTVAGAANISVDLESKLAGLVKPEVKVYAYNAQNSIRSREVSSRGSNSGVTDEEAKLVTPKMVAVIGSVENYANPNLALNYSDDDAISVTLALLAMSKGLGSEIHIELVCDAPSAKTMFPGSVTVYPANKAGFDKAFRSAAQKAGADSAYLVYLSGHGAALPIDGGKNNEFFYLTRDARDSSPTSLGNPEIAKQFYVSGTEIREYMALALNCKRRLVILDTCSAGASKEELLALKGEMEDLARARKEFQQGTGTYALMGAAEGKVSLEASEYGHGLLTYAFLTTLKNEKLGNDKSPDMVIAAALLLRTQAVTKDLAKAINRGQEPVAIAPNAGTVVLGLMNDNARRAIVLTSRLPLLLKPALTDIESGDTALASKLADVLRERSLRRRDGDGAQAFAAYLDQDSAPDAYRLQGTYSESGGVITVKAKVWKNGKPESKAFPVVTGNVNDVVDKLANELKKWLGA